MSTARALAGPKKWRALRDFKLPELLVRSQFEAIALD